jgi:hypothetical protein
VSRVPVKPRAKKVSAVTHIADAPKRTPGKRAPKRAVAVEKEAPRRGSASAPNPYASDPNNWQSLAVSSSIQDVLHRATREKRKASVSASAPLKKARMDIQPASPEELEATRALREEIRRRDAEDGWQEAANRASALKEHDRVLPVHVTRADHARSVRDLHAAIDRAERGNMGDAKGYAAENAKARRRESLETWLAVGLAFAVVIAIAVFMTVWG